jgi:hypothetical protein
MMNSLLRLILCLLFSLVSPPLSLCSALGHHRLVLEPDIVIILPTHHLIPKIRWLIKKLGLKSGDGPSEKCVASCV